MERINGTVARIVNVSPTGGAIFRISLENTARTVRVVAPGKSIQSTPTFGESWTIFGNYVHDRQYGLQFVATNAIQQIPAGHDIASLLARHPSFAEFGTIVGRRLWRVLGPRAYNALDSADYMVIARATGITPTAAVRLIQVWRSYCAQIEVSTFFAARGIPPRLATRAIVFWGSSTVEVVSANPYLLTTFIHWKQVDAIAMDEFAVTLDSPLRLIAACTLSVDRYCLQHLSQAVPLSKLRFSLRARVGSNALTTRAIELSLASGAITLAGAGSEKFAQSRGQYIVTNSLRRRLSELADRALEPSNGPFENSCAHGRSPLEVYPSSLPFSGPSVIVLAASVHEFSGLLLVPCLAHATHIFSANSQRKLIGLPSGSKESYLLAEILLNDSARLKTNECYVIHAADDIDVVMGCKLLHALPGLPKIFVLTATTEREFNRSSFLNIVDTIPGVAQICEGNGSAAVLSRTHNDEISSIERPEQFLVSQDEKRITISRLEATADLENRVLAAYRKAIATSTAIIVASTAQAARRYNNALHEEQKEVRKFERQTSPLLQLAENYTATIGDTVVCCRNDYNKGLLAGSTGKIIDIVHPLISSHGILANVTVAHAVLDTIGHVALSASDCLNFQMGYAVPVSLDRWSSQAVRIVCIDARELPAIGQLRKWISRTSVSLIVAGVEMDVLDSLLLEIQPTKFEFEKSL